MRTTDLPCELTDKIIDSLGGDVPSLKSCALTCRAWMHRSNEWLHNSIAVRADESSALEPLLRRYESSPNRKHVRRATLRVFQTEQNGVPIEQLSDTLRQIFNFFPNLCEIDVNVFLIEALAVLPFFTRADHTIATVGAQWPQDVTLMLVGFVPHIEFGSPSLFCRFLQSIPQLSRIVIVGKVQFSPEHTWFSADALSSKVALPALREFYPPTFWTRRDRDQFYLWLCKDREDSPLQSIAVSGGCTAGVNQALAALGDNLRKLKYSQEAEHEPSEALLQLKPCHSLQTLCFGYCSSGWIASSLRDNFLPNLRYVAISHRVFSFADFAPLDWSALDDSLPTCCPSLVSLTLILEPYEYNELSRRGPYAAPLGSGKDRVRDPAVCHAIRVTVRARMPRMIRNNTLRLVLTVKHEGSIMLATM